MSKSIITTQRGQSGSPWRIIPKEAQIGEQCTVTAGTDDVVFGDVVYAVPGSDTTAIGGEDSYMLTVEKPDTANSSAESGNLGACFAGVVQEVDGINAGKKGAVEFGPATLLVNVYLAAGEDTIVAGQALIAGSTGPDGFGNLRIPAGTGGHVAHKVIAKAARGYTGLAPTTTVQIWVHFDGIYGFGNEESNV